MAVMTGIDPHRRSHTAVALNGTDAVVGQLRVTADRRQLDRLLASPSRGPNACGRSRTPTAWDAMLSRQLLDAGEGGRGCPREAVSPGAGSVGRGAQDRQP